MQHDFAKKYALILDRRMSGQGDIHDIRSDGYRRRINFAPGCKYAVVLAYCHIAGRADRGYSTHKTLEAARRASERLRRYSHEVIDRDGDYVRI